MKHQQAPTLRDQISDHCVHFNGIMNKTCKAGIEYCIAPIPCFKKNGLPCSAQKFPTVDEVDAQLAAITKQGTAGIVLLLAAKAHFVSTGKRVSEFKCPHGDHQATYNCDNSKKHFHIRCTTCELSMME